jgi:hypothetical protein
MANRNALFSLARCSLSMLLLAGGTIRAADVIPEPAQALVQNNSVARLSDGTLLLIQPAGNRKELFISRTPRPVTLKDFAEPITLFGDGGVLSDDAPSCVAIAVNGDAVHVISGSGHTLAWYLTSSPVSGKSKWESISTEVAGTIHLQDVVTANDNVVHAVYREAPSENSAWRIAVTTFSDGKLGTKTVAESQEVLDAARAAASGHDSLDVVWTESELTPRVVYAQLNTKSLEAADTQYLQPGMHPDILRIGKRTFIVSENSDGNLRAEWRGPGGLEVVQTLIGRAGYRPVLAADEHGVAWLFAVGADQRGFFYRRFLGSGFGAEAECGAAPGMWKLSLGFAVQPYVGTADDGFAMLHGEYLGEFEEYRYRFRNLPVPRYSVRDPRHVMFLDMLEVAEIENLHQQVSTAVRSEANPLKLNGPPGSPDAAVAGYATVLPEDGKFRMWYNGESDTSGRNWVVSYAESSDGLQWTKPELGIVEHNGSKKNNLLFPIEYGTNTPLVIKDEAESDPARRYKMVFESAVNGGTDVYLNWSADGIHWQWPPHRLWGKSPGHNKTIRGFHPWHEPLSSFFRDPLSSHPDYLWKVYGQDIYAGNPHFYPAKARNMCLVHGPTPYEFVPYSANPVLDPRTGWQEDQVHGGLVQPYEGVYVSLYQHWQGEDWKVDFRLAASRDGLHFVRIDPQSAVLPLGPAGSWDSGMLCTPNFFFERDGKLWLYYRGSVGTLATGRVLSSAQNSPDLQQSDPWRMMTGLARLRRDGFAYLTVGAMEYLTQPPRYVDIPKYRAPTEGRLATIPVEAEGIGERTLHINLENFAPGFASVKAQFRDDQTGEVIPGYSFDDCDPAGDPSLDHRITWNGSADLDQVNARRIRVEFQLFGALDSPQLYSFWFAED